MKMPVPHTFVLILALIAAMALLTWILPAGEFSRRTDETTGRQVIVPGSYRAMPANPQGLLSVLAAPIHGLVSAGEIIAFVIIVGGAFGVIEKTGAIRAGIAAIIGRLRHRSILIVPICTVLLSIGGTTMGMSEETIPLYLIFIPLLLALGYDSLVSVAIIFVGSTVGAVGSTFNPFVTGIAQALVGLAPGSGSGFRFGIWLVVTSITAAFVVAYARRIRTNPAASRVAESDRLNREHFLALEQAPDAAQGFSRVHKATLTILGAGFAVISVGVLEFDWYITEIAMCFLGVALAVALVARMNSFTACEAFTTGTREIMGAVLVIGFARGVMVIAQDGYILDTMLFHAARAIEGLPSWLYLQLAFCFHFLFGLIVPSSSAAAATAMPVLGPLADLAGVPQQQNVTAFQLGHGIAILFTPTSGPLVAGLAIARIPWTTFVRFVAPLIGSLVAAALLMLWVSSRLGS